MQPENEQGVTTLAATGGAEIAAAVLAFADTLADLAIKRIKAAEASAASRQAGAKDDPQVIAAKTLLGSIEHGRTWVRAAMEPPSDSYQHTPFTTAERESVLLCSASGSLDYLISVGRSLWRVEQDAELQLESGKTK